MPLHLIQASEN